MRKPTDLTKLVPDPHGLLPLTEAAIRRRRVKIIANLILVAAASVAVYFAYPYIEWVMALRPTVAVATNEELAAHPPRNYNRK